MTADLLRDRHPLDHTPAPDYIPPSWDGPHVGKRLVEALRTLRHLPTTSGPREFGNAWPFYQYEWTDALAQLEADKAQQEADARERNRTRIIPSAAEIGRMETAIVWPARYLRDFPQLLAVVHCAAFGRAGERDLEWTARLLNLPGRLVRRWNREGLDLIASGLRRDVVAIF